MSLDIDEIIVLAMVAITAVLVMVVPPENLGEFVILILIGLLVVRALSSPYIRDRTGTEIDALTVLAFIIYILILVKHVLNLLRPA